MPTALDLEDRSLLIVGAGYLGGEIARRAVRRWSGGVTVLRRSDKPVARGADRLLVDLTDREGVEDASIEADVVICCLAPDGSSEDAYRRAYIDAVGNLVGALARSPRPVRRLVLISSTSVLGDRDGGTVDASSAPDPTSYRGETQREMESLVREQISTAVALRLGGVYGPDRLGTARSVRDGSARRANNPRFGNRIHRDDAARAALHLAALRAPEPVYIGVDDDPASSNDVYDWLATRLDVPRPPIDDDAARSRRGSKRCRNDALRASGFRFLYPTFREGYAFELERAARAQG